MEGSCPSSSSSGSEYECNPLTCHICMAVPTNPVATTCGHLFCWPCLYEWLQIRFRPCPVCRTTLKWSKQYVIPISGDGAVVPTDGSDSSSSPQRCPSSATPELASQPFPTRNAVLHALCVIETAHEHLQKEQTFGFFRTRRLCQIILQAVMDIANPVQRQVRQNAENLHQENWRSIKREREERTTMAADIAGLQRMVTWSNQYLPSWWTSGMGD